MNIYFINPGKDFSAEQQKRVRNLKSVYFIDSISELDNAPGIFSDQEKIIGVDPDYTNWKFSNEILEKIPNIKALCLATTDYSYVDLDYCQKRNIVVTNLPKYATESVAEYLMFLAMCLAKKLPLQIKNDNHQDFSPSFLQRNLGGGQVGIIGLGQIGGKIAQLCKDMNMDVMYWSRKSRDKNYKYVDLDRLFETADFIFCTLVISDETKKIITDDLLNKMKSTASFVSGAGASLHNHKLLLDKVAKSEIFGYALEEPNRNIFDYKGNVMVTSEYAWFTDDAANIRINRWIDSIESILRDSPMNVVVK